MDPGMWVRACGVMPSAIRTRGAGRQHLQGLGWQGKPKGSSMDEHVLVVAAW